MTEDSKLSIDELEDGLREIAEAVSLTLEGFYSSAPEYYGILPWVVRAEGETRDTLPSRQVRDLAEGVFADLFPQALIDRNSSRDIRDVARSGRVDATCVTGHRRVELLTRFGRPDIAEGESQKGGAPTPTPAGKVGCPQSP